MASDPRLTSVPPQPMSSTSSHPIYDPSGQPQPILPQSHQQPPYNTQEPDATISNFGLRLGPESQIPDHPGSMVDIPRPPAQTFSPTLHQQPQQQQQQQQQGWQSQPQLMAQTSTSMVMDIRSVRASASYGLREYMTLQKKRQRFDGSTTSVDLEAQIRSQARNVLGDLDVLQAQVRRMAKASENHRWRKWLVGGLIAGFIPIVRRFFRRGKDKDSQDSSNDTEYAFKRSQGMLSHIKDSVLGKGHLASVAFFVFAVLYVFHNEVSLRVAKTIQKRIRKVAGKIEQGDANIGEEDMKIFEGWRWRVLLWK